MCLPPIISISFNTGETSTQEKVSYNLDFYVSFDVNFSYFGELKSNIFTSPNFAIRDMY